MHHLGNIIVNKIFNKNSLFYFALFLISVFYFYFFLKRGITLYDEGYIVESSLLVFLGKVPYKDFYFQYTPLTIWTGSLIFKLFGVGILSLRFFSLLIYAFTSIAGFYVVNKIVNRRISLLVFLGFLSWGFPNANFLWPSSMATLFLFLTFVFFIKFVKERNDKWVFGIGISTALSVLTKQNLGGAIIFLSVLFLIYLNKKKILLPILMRFLAGFVLIIVPSLCYIYIQNPKLVGISEFLYRSGNVALGKTLISGHPQITFPPLVLDGFIKWISKLFLYYSPIVYLISFIFSNLRKKINDKLFFGITTLSIIYAFIVIWPTADLAHYTFAVPALILFFTTSIKNISSIWIKHFAVLSITTFTLIGFYKTFFMSYYTFETPYSKMKNYTNVRGETILTDMKYSTIISFMNTNRENLFKDKSVFVYGYAPMLYFVLDKVPTVSNLYTIEGLLSQDSLHGDVLKLEKNNPDVIILEVWRESNSELSSYIRKNYEVVDKIWDLEILQKTK